DDFSRDLSHNLFLGVSQHVSFSARYLLGIFSATALLLTLGSSLRSMRQSLELCWKGVHAAGAVPRDLDCLREDAPGLALPPFRIEQVDVEGEYHAFLKPIADHFDRVAIGGNRVVSEPRIFQRCEPVAVDAGLADREAARVDFVFDGHEGGRDRLARSEML